VDTCSWSCGVLACKIIIFPLGARMFQQESCFMNQTEANSQLLQTLSATNGPKSYSTIFELDESCKGGISKSGKRMNF